MGKGAKPPGRAWPVQTGWPLSEPPWVPGVQWHCGWRGGRQRPLGWLPWALSVGRGCPCIDWGQSGWWTLCHPPTCAMVGKAAGMHLILKNH